MADSTQLEEPDNKKGEEKPHHYSTPGSRPLTKIAFGSINRLRDSFYAGRVVSSTANNVCFRFANDPSGIYPAGTLEGEGECQR